MTSQDLTPRSVDHLLVLLIRILQDSTCIGFKDGSGIPSRDLLVFQRLDRG